MMALINALQAIQSNMRIHLGRRDVGMPEDRLHGSQIRTIFYHVRSAAMSQHVWTGVPPVLRRFRSHHLPHALSRKLLRAACEEYQGRTPAARQDIPPFFRISLNGLDRRLAQRNNPLLIALASNQHVPEIQLQVFRLNSHDLRYT
jgi:hypothetical protein